MIVIHIFCCLMMVLGVIYLVKNKTNENPDYLSAFDFLLVVCAILLSKFSSKNMVAVDFFMVVIESVYILISNKHRHISKIQSMTFSCILIILLVMVYWKCYSEVFKIYF